MTEPNKAEINYSCPECDYILADIQYERAKFDCCPRCNAALKTFIPRVKYSPKWRRKLEEGND